MSSVARPQDDFYRYANGGWLEEFALPDHRAEATMLSLLAEQVQDALAAICGRAAELGDAPGRRIADLYASFMDEELIEWRGAAALRADLHAIRSAADPAALARGIGRLQAQGVAGPVEVAVAVDTVRAEGYVLALGQGGLGLPGRAFYRETRHEGLRERYAAHLRAMLSLAEIPGPDLAAAIVMRAETEMAERHAPPGADETAADSADSTAGELAARRGGFPWAEWLGGLGRIPAEAAVNVRPASLLGALDEWWESHDLEELKHWMVWRYVHEMAPFGPSAVFTENFRFYGQVLTGSREPRPRWMRATSFVQTILGDAVGERYVRDHLAPGAVKAAAELVDALVAAYRTRLGRASWMSEGTRDAALAKLGEMRFEIGFPGTEGERAELRTDPGDLIGNVKRGRAWHIAGDLARLGGPVDRSEWKIPPQAVTAYYRHGLNQVVIPAALLQPPLFDPSGDAAGNFALLGSIVCHEMSHAFDSRGARYDGQGRVREWWTAEDRAEFARRTALLVGQYDRYVPEDGDGQHVNGARTLSENIADVIGLIVALEAFRTAQPVTAADTRRFFTLWASMWRSKRTQGRTIERLRHDRHAPPQFRCNGALGHVPEFYEAFGVTEPDGMHIRPESRFALI